MLLGNKNTLAFELDPVQPSWERRSPADRGPWARLAIWVGGRNLTAHTRDGSDRVGHGVFIPLAPIADWLVKNAVAIAYEESPRLFATDVDLQVARTQWRNVSPPEGLDEDTWDDERYSWTGRHFILAGAEAAWLSDLALVRSDDRLWISWGPPAFASPEAPRFLEESGTVAVPWHVAVETLDALVDHVGVALQQAGLEASYPWAAYSGGFLAALDVAWERYIDLAVPCGRDRLLAMFSKRDLADVRSALALEAEASPLQSVALQCLRDLNGDNGIGPALLECEQVTRRPGTEEYRTARQVAKDAARAGDSPETQGKEAARAVRGLLGLEAEPLPDNCGQISLKLGIELDESHQGSSDDFGLFGARADGRAVIYLLASERTIIPWAKRMELARGLGHLFLDAGAAQGVIGAGSSSRACGPRRRRSGAFAAELVLPLQAMLKVSAGKLDTAAKSEVFRSLLEKYDVGARTAAWQLFNAGLLSSRERVEDLIAQFGADQGR